MRSVTVGFRRLPPDVGYLNMRTLSQQTPRRLVMDGVFDLFLKERIDGNGSCPSEGDVSGQKLGKV